MVAVARIICPNCTAECLEREQRCWQCGAKLHAGAKPIAAVSNGAPASSSSQTVVLNREMVDDVLPAEDESSFSPTSPTGTGLFGRMRGKGTRPVEGPKQVEDIAEKLIDFSEGTVRETVPLSSPTQDLAAPLSPSGKKMRQLMDGTFVEVEEVALPSTVTGLSESLAGAKALGETTPLVRAGEIGGKAIMVPAGEELMVVSYCKNCGFQNVEGVRECAQCKTLLAVVAKGSIGEIEMPPRAWGFDVLGLAWTVLGLSAILCNQFLIRVDHKGKVGWSDFLWTGIVALAPGIFIFLRHYFCKYLFAAMSLGSVLVWSVIGFIWLYVGTSFSDNASIALAWLAALSILTLISWITVRSNDAFDVGQ